MLKEETEPVPVLTMYPAPSRRIAELCFAAAFGAGSLGFAVYGLVMIAGGEAAGWAALVLALLPALLAAGTAREAIATSAPSLRVTAAGITRLHPRRATMFIAWPDVVSLGERRVGNVLHFAIFVTGGDAITAFGKETAITRNYRQQKAISLPPQFMSCSNRELAERILPYRPDVTPQPLDGTRDTPPEPTDFATLSVRGNLAQAMIDRGQGAEAVARLQQLVADTVQLVGEDDENVFAFRNNLAEARRAAGDREGGIADLRGLISGLERVFGPWDPRTLQARGNLATMQGEAGDASAAVDALATVVSDSTRCMDPDARQLLVARANLAEWRGRAGDPAAAVKDLIELSSDCRRALGTADGDTIGVGNTLARWQRATGTSEKL